MTLFSGKFLLKSILNTLKGKEHKDEILEFLNVMATKDPISSLESTKPSPQEKFEGFLDLDYLNSIFLYRCRYRLLHLALNYQKRIRSGKTNDEAINSSAFELIQAARATNFMLLFKTFYRICL